jgi:predicted ATPase
MQGKDFCGCEHSVTLYEFLIAARNALQANFTQDAIEILEVGIKLHQRIEKEYIRDILDNSDYVQKTTFNHDGTRWPLIKD